MTPARKIPFVFIGRWRRLSILTQYRLVTGLNFPTPQILLNTFIDRSGNNLTNYILTGSVDPGGLRIAIETNGPNWLERFHLRQRLLHQFSRCLPDKNLD